MKKRILAGLIIAIMALFVSCGSATEEDASSSSIDLYSKEAIGLTEEAADYDYDYDAFETENTDSGAEVNLEGYDTSRKIVYSSYISLESKKFDDDVAAVKELVASNGGYFENSSMYGNLEYGNRSANFTARIPSDKYQAFMNSVGDVGSLTSKNESINDITSSYVDVQARLKSLNTKLERLQELETNAENVTELLEIEDRINDVQYEIESYTAQMKVYDDQVDYSTVNIDISEVATYTEVKADSAWNRFVEAFGESFVGFITFLQNVVIILIYMLPYIIIICIILFIIFRLRRKAKRNKDKKKSENNQVEQSE